jgi:hypothetical protein
VGQVRLVANVDATLTQLAITADGTVDESLGIGDTVTYIDSNSDGGLDAGDVQLGLGQAFKSNNGTVTMTGLSLSLTAGTPVDVILVTEVTGAANVGDTLTFRVEGWRALATNSGGAVAVVGGGISGSLQVIGTDPPKTLTVAVVTPFSSTVAADAIGVPMLALRFTTTTGALDLHSMSFVTWGTGDDAVDILEAQLGRDANLNGVLDAGETVLGSATPQGDDGRLTFNFGGQRLSSSSSTFDLALSYTLAGTAEVGEIFVVELETPAGVTAHAYSGNGGQLISVANAPILGRMRIGSAPATLNLRAAGDAVRLDAGGSEGVALTLDLTTGGAAIDLTSLRVNATGTVNDVATQVGLYEDTDGDGAFSSADAALSPLQGFPADDGAVTFSAPLTLPASATTRVFVTATLAAGLPAGQSFSLTVDPGADVVATATASGTQFQGALLVTGSGTASVVQPDPDLGKDAYLRGEGLYLNDNFGHQGLTVGDRSSGQLGERLFYTEFPLPLGAAPTRAYVALFLTSTGGLTGASLDVQVFRVVPTANNRTPWGEGRGGFDASIDGICFDGTIQATARPDLTHPNVDPTVLDEVRVAAGSQGRWVLFDVTAAAQAWYAGTAENLGLRFRDKDYAVHDDGAVSFHSSDASQGRLRPVFLLER